MKLSDFKPDPRTVDVINYIQSTRLNIDAMRRSAELAAMLHGPEVEAQAKVDLLLYAAQLQARVRELEGRLKETSLTS